MFQDRIIFICMDFSKFDTSENCVSIEGHIIVLRFGEELARFLKVSGSEELGGWWRKYATILGQKGYKHHPGFVYESFLKYLFFYFILFYFILFYFILFYFILFYFILFFIWIYFILLLFFLLYFSHSPLSPLPFLLSPLGFWRNIEIYLPELILSTFLLMEVLITIKVPLVFWGLFMWLKL